MFPTINYVIYVQYKWKITGHMYIISYVAWKNPKSLTTKHENMHWLNKIRSEGSTV